MRVLATVIAIMTTIATSLMAADYTIRNPADKIDNPAGRMSNPAETIHNPAANITNPSDQLANPDPVRPLRQTEAKPKEAAAPATPTPAPPVVPARYYTYKRVREYLDAAKRAFGKDDYLEFTALTEDALRRINSGGLKASKKTVRKLEKFKAFGYAMLTRDEDI